MLHDRLAKLLLGSSTGSARRPDDPAHHRGSEHLEVHAPSPIDVANNHAVSLEVVSFMRRPASCALLPFVIPRLTEWAEAAGPVIINRRHLERLEGRSVMHTVGRQAPMSRRSLLAGTDEVGS